MNIFIQLTSAGADTGPFSLYSNMDMVTPFASGVSQGTLLSGDNYNIPDGATEITISSTGLCTTSVILPITLVPTTTTTTTVDPSSTTTTTTVAPSTTTTTTTVQWYAYILSFGNSKIEACSASPVVAYSSTSSFVIGMFLFTDQGLSIPVSGYTHVVNGTDTFLITNNEVGTSDGPCA